MLLNVILTYLHSEQNIMLSISAHQIRRIFLNGPII